MNPDGRSCATCAKAHLASETLAGVTLECRAGPPARDGGRYSRYPEVRETDYCHDAYERDPNVAMEES